MILKNKSKFGEPPQVKAEFSSTMDVLDFVGGYRNRMNAGRDVQNWKSRFTRRDSFTDNKNFNDLAREISNPMLEMADSLSIADAQTADNIGIDVPMSRRRRMRRLDSGDEIDVDRYLARDPDMWEQMRSADTNRRIIRIYVNMGANCAWRKEDFKWRTSAIVAIARLLEDTKILCEIIAVKKVKKCFTKKTYGRKCGSFNMTFPVKRSDQLLDIETIAYVLGSQVFYRVGTICALIMATDVLHEEESISDDCKIDCELGCSENVNQSEVKESEYVVSGTTNTENGARFEVERFAKWLKTTIIGEMSVVG